MSNLTVNASPTKEFFIFMLTRDIELSRAILDLIDNCIDGALRVRGDAGRFDGLFVKIEVGADHFRILDNCGGMAADIARDYAFRFGRPKGFTHTKHSIGQFGVGMKRALFKLGEVFTVQSTTARSRFVLPVDVGQWLQIPEENDGIRADWEFEFAEVDERKEGEEEFPPNQHGTDIVVRRLHPPVASAFQLDTYLQRLRAAISEAHRIAIDRGLGITLNDLPLEHRPLEFLQSDQLRPAYEEARFPDPSDPTRPVVTVRLYAGVSDSRPNEAGWYVFCNGRLVLGADQTERTVWGERGETRIPRAHGQFARFRGYAYFDCDDAERLPWNTTKTGVDTDSPVYHGARLLMIALTRPVINFLNDLKTEAENEEEDGVLERVVLNAHKVRIHEVEPSVLFRAPERTTVPKAQVQRIQYDAPLDKFKAVKMQLRARTIKEVGEMTFAYYYDLECADQ